MTDRRVRALAQEGRIEGARTEAGWKLFRYSVHSFRDDKRARERPLAAREAESTLSISEWLGRVESLQRELGRLEGRLEITERAESTVREERDRLLRELEEERQQHLQDVERERSERLEAQEGLEQLSQERAQVQDETEQLRAELEAERSKGFWSRLFGG